MGITPALALLAVFACKDEEPRPTVTEAADADTDTDSDTDVDSDTDTDSDTEAVTPKVLLVIADDLGIDALSAYSTVSQVDTTARAFPSTPAIDSLCDGGVRFDRALANPTCTATRGTLLTGQYGFRTGLDGVGMNFTIDPTTPTLPQVLRSGTDVVAAHVGKWHLGNTLELGELDAPLTMGWSFYQGPAANIDDYFAWEEVVGGVELLNTTYATTATTETAIDWLAGYPADQASVVWLAYNAPHEPFHEPPAGLHGIVTGGDSALQYDAAVEAMDTELARLLTRVDPQTIVVFIGDNGTPPSARRSPYQNGRLKASLYQGGIHVPLCVSGPGVIPGVHDGLVQSVDVFATITDLMGLPLPGGVATDSVSLASLLSDPTAPPVRSFAYVEQNRHGAATQGGLRGGHAYLDTQYKALFFEDGTEELYDLLADPLELSDLAAVPAYQTVLDGLRAATTTLRAGPTIDITDAVFTETSGTCMDHVRTVEAHVTDVNRNMLFDGALHVSATASTCRFESNGIPNHDFNDGVGFPNNVAEVAHDYEVTRTPSAATTPSALQILSDDAIFLNGVKLDLLAAACYGIGPDPLGMERIGCGVVPTPWRYDPMFSGSGFRTDSHHAHTQPDGGYHYHGSPLAMFELTNPTAASPVIGFAADGFPIFGPYIDDNGTVREVQSGYTLKPGARVSQAGEGAFPGGAYDGTFRDDWEWTGAGDLDACNGRTHNGVYGYHVTNTYPWVLACFTGTPDPSFDK